MKKAFPQEMIAFMRKNGIILSGKQPHLLCVSGGLDSVCMVHLFQEAGLPFAIAHCNFHLRGEESDGDAAFVENLAKLLKVPFHLAHFDTKKEAEKPGVSIQMAARSIRYEFFEKTRAENDYCYVVTAHHQDDNIETTLFNFGRGSSLKGLSGIPIQNGQIIRPLLHFSRIELEEYVHENNIKWREDSSNKKDDYARNIIRHQIVPKFKELNLNFTQTAGRTIGRISASNENLKALSRLFLKENLQKGHKNEETETPSTVQILAFSALSDIPYPAEILFYWLAPFGFNREQCRQLEAQRNDGQSGMQLVGNEDWKITRRRTDFLLENTKSGTELSLLIQANDLMVRLPQGGFFFMIQAENAGAFPNGETEILVDKKALKFPLTLRNWRAGDTFQPFGMEGKHQKIQDYLTNHKVASNEKSKVRVLENGDGKIIWLVGYRMADWLRVEDSTKECLKIRIE